MTDLKKHLQANLISQSITIPFVSEFDEEEDELYFYHRDSGKEIEVIDYYAPSWDDDEKLNYNHILEVVPAVLNLYDKIKNDPDAQICHIKDFTKEEDSDPLPFIIAAVKNPHDLID